MYSVYGSHIIMKAEIFATAAHAAIDQRRKFTNEPYIVHPREVATIVGALPQHNYLQVALAWLHDTVEDTEVTHAVIDNVFAIPEISEGMFYLTNVEREAGNRKARHAMNCQRLKDSPPEVATVKIADIFSNTRNIAALGGTFAPLFLSEKIGAMEAVQHGDRVLWEMTMKQIQAQMKELNLAA